MCCHMALYIRDPTFDHFGTVPTRVGQTDKQTTELVFVHFGAS